MFAKMNRVHNVIQQYYNDAIKWKHFFVTGALWGDRWILLTMASDAELWCFLWSSPGDTVEQTAETPVIWQAIAFVTTSLGCAPWNHYGKDHNIAMARRHFLQHQFLKREICRTPVDFLPKVSLWCRAVMFHWCQSKQAVEQTVESRVIRDIVTLMWHQWNAAVRDNENSSANQPFCLYQQPNRVMTPLVIWVPCAGICTSIFATRWPKNIVKAVYGNLTTVSLTAYERWIQIDVFGEMFKFGVDCIWTLKKICYSNLDFDILNCKCTTPTFKSHSPSKDEQSQNR